MKNRFSRATNAANGAFSSATKQTSASSSARDYFDDEDDDVPQPSLSRTSLAVEPDIDPLDAFMYAFRLLLCDINFFWLSGAEFKNRL